MLKIVYLTRIASFLPLALVACSLPGASTTHLAWTFDRNLIAVDARVGGVEGEFVVGSTQPETILDEGLLTTDSSRRTVRVAVGRHVAAVRPVRAALEGLADGILGVDVWGGRSLTIDYKRRLLILGRAPEPVDERRHRFRTAPAIPIVIDGREELALIDTANPDTILLPARFGTEGRVRVDLVVADVRFHDVDAAIAPVSEIRLGNRILSSFLVTIDYPRREASLWYNP